MCATEYRETPTFFSEFPSNVIPAKAGIRAFCGLGSRYLDPRFRGGMARAGFSIHSTGMFQQRFPAKLTQRGSFALRISQAD